MSFRYEPAATHRQSSVDLYRTGKAPLIYTFENYCLDLNRRELRRGTEAIPMEPRVFDLLEFLVRNQDRVVNKDELIAAVWNGRIVSDSAITSRINEVHQIPDLLDFGMWIERRIDAPHKILADAVVKLTEQHEHGRPDLCRSRYGDSYR